MGARSGTADNTPRHRRTVIWWCSAQGTPWSWSWQAYPGAWLFVAALVAGYVLAARRLGDRGGGAAPHRVLSFAAGAVLLWIVVDWPVGPLGAGYLASVNMGRYLVFALIAPPLLIHGLPPHALRALLAPRWAMRAARRLSHPLIAFAIFNITMLATHLPETVDAVGGSQLGSFAVDMAWLASGLVFWWPVLAPLPELEPLPYPGRIVYLIANVFIPTVPAAFLTFSDYPLYALYELAPPVGRLSTVEDQQLAGLAMKIAGGMIIFATASVLFFRWHAVEERAEGVA